MERLESVLEHEQVGTSTPRQMLVSSYSVGCVCLGLLSVPFTSASFLISALRAIFLHC